MNPHNISFDLHDIPDDIEPSVDAPLYLRILPKEPSSRKHDWGYQNPNAPKGRTFVANLLGYLECDALWEAPTGDPIHPILLVVSGSEGSIKPFCANLQIGKVSEITDSPTGWTRRGGDRIELKSIKYKTREELLWGEESPGTVETVGTKGITSTRQLQGVRRTFFLPAPFEFKHAMLEDSVKFCVAPARTWLSRQWGGVSNPLKENLACPLQDLFDWYRNSLSYPYPLTIDTLPEFLAMAALFCLHLERRTTSPIIHDVRFYGLTLLAALNEGLATFASTGDHYYRDRAFGVSPSLKMRQYGMDTLGLIPIAMSASHDSIQTMLGGILPKYLTRWAA